MSNAPKTNVDDSVANQNAPTVPGGTDWAADSRLVQRLRLRYQNDLHLLPPGDVSEASLLACFAALCARGTLSPVNVERVRSTGFRLYSGRDSRTYAINWGQGRAYYWRG